MSNINDTEREAFEALLQDPGLAAMATADMHAAANMAEAERMRQEYTQSLPNLLNEQPPALPSERSELGLAKRFAEIYGDELRYVPEWEWCVWTGTKWQTGSKELARQRCMEYLDRVLLEATQAGIEKAMDAQTNKLLTWASRIRSAKTIRSILELAAPLLLSETSEFDSDPWLLNTLGGMVDLRTGNVMPHRADAKCTMLCKADPNAPANGAAWLELVDTVTCGDTELAEYLQILFGMSAVGKVYHEGIAIFYGGGSNGKSTLCNPIRTVLGEYATAIAPEALMARKNGDEARGAAALVGKRLAIASETEEGQRLSTALVKRLASTDEVAARKLYKEAFNYTPSHTLVLFTNNLPKISGTDPGIWRRIFAVPFNAKLGATHGQKRAVNNYGDVLVRDNSADILRWVIEGASLFYRRGCKLPEAPEVVAKATEEYRKSEDWVQNFCDECCIVDPLSASRSSTLYSAYRTWAERNGEYKRRVQDFSTGLEKAGFIKVSVHGYPSWRGVKLNEDYSAPEPYGNYR